MTQASTRIDTMVRAMYRRHHAVFGCCALQLAGWIAGAAEIWIALWFFDHPVSVTTAIAIEALIQAVSSAAFVVPGGLGVQEGAFLVIGAAFGIDSPAALALAVARRLRDAIVFFPGLLFWQWSESRNLTAHHKAMSERNPRRDHNDAQRGSRSPLIPDRH
jgi:uncharacterized membrane protein YbhN (UPF0104 family)